MIQLPILNAEELLTLRRMFCDWQQKKLRKINANNKVFFLKRQNELLKPKFLIVM